MALAGHGILAIWNGIGPEAEDDFVAWHMREHIPERVAVPGFLKGRRYVAERGAPKYFNFYEVASPATLESADYISRLNAPSAWTKRVVRHFQDTSRTICRVVSSSGLGDGAYVATVRLSAAIDSTSFAAALQPVMDAITNEASIVAAHLLEGHGGGSNTSTAETDLRQQPDSTVDWLLLVEASDAAPLDDVLRKHLEPSRIATFSAGYDPARDSGVYRLQYGLARSQLD